MKDLITGIQQAGIGVVNANEAKHLYKDLFGMNVLIFEDFAGAPLMKKYTGSEVHQRHAIFSINLSGGGGFEIWQFTSRTPEAQPLPRFGDIGIIAIKIKTGNVKAAHTHFKKNPLLTVSDLMQSPDDKSHFWLCDSYKNYFDIIQGDEWFKHTKSICGGVTGAMIGVTDLDRSILFYKNVLGIDEVVYNITAAADNLPGNEQSAGQCKRALLKKPAASKGAFSKLLGSVQLELIESLDFWPVRIYKNRFWGDCGFIHICFDVVNMDALKQQSENAGFPFTVDSADSFSMGSSAGRFCYVEDPDGTLIELVETHKIAVFKKINWSLNLKNRKNKGPLPHWMIAMLGLNKIK